MNLLKAGGTLAILSSIINWIIVILVFGLCIFIHEFGHFIAAKKSGVFVNEFAIGMGPCLFKRTKGETQYSLRLLPIGGYCAMLGEDEESDDERAFCNINVWKRIIIVVAGVCFNFLLAFVMSIVLISLCGINDNQINQVAAGSAAEAAGLQAGDKVVRMDGEKIYNFREISVAMQFYDGEEPIRMLIQRGGDELLMNIEVQPKQLDSGLYQLGIGGGYRKATGPIDVIKYSVLEMRYWMKTTLISLKELITGGVSIKQLSGPVGIGTAMNDVMEQAQESGGMLDVFVNAVNFTILLCVNLGVMNILPLPALDGGRLVFLLVEALTKKKVPSNIEAVIHNVGLVLLLCLMAVVMYQDIIKIIKP